MKRIHLRRQMKPIPTFWERFEDAALGMLLPYVIFFLIGVGMALAKDFDSSTEGRGGEQKCDDPTPLILDRRNVSTGEVPQGASNYRVRSQGASRNQARPVENNSSALSARIPSAAELQRRTASGSADPAKAEPESRKGLGGASATNSERPQQNSLSPARAASGCASSEAGRLLTSILDGDQPGKAVQSLNARTQGGYSKSVPAGHDCRPLELHPKYAFGNPVENSFSTIRPQRSSGPNPEQAISCADREESGKCGVVAMNTPGTHPALGPAGESASRAPGAF